MYYYLIVEEVKSWLRDVEKLIRKLKNIDLSGIVVLLKKLNKARQEALKASMKYTEIKLQIAEIITRAIKTTR